MNATFRRATAVAMLILVVAGAAPAAAAVAGDPELSQTAAFDLDARAATGGTPGAATTSTTTYPSSLNLFNASGFRYQDPNMYACTSTNAMDMLNFIALASKGGTAFQWKVDLSAATRDSILAWERTHDTLKGGNGSDPHGWRNALNYYGWGTSALWAGKRYYDDYSYMLYDSAVKAAVRAIIRYRKPVGILAWAGKHAQMLTGYFGLSGDPFAKDANGRYTNKFTVSGFYLSDPLKSQARVNSKVYYTTLKSSTNMKLRFQPYYETDSPYDDPYTSGVRASKDEWYGKFVIIAPVK